MLKRSPTFEESLPIEYDLAMARLRDLERRRALFDADVRGGSIDETIANVWDALQGGAWNVRQLAGDPLPRYTLGGQPTGRDAAPYLALPVPPHQDDRVAREIEREFRDMGRRFRGPDVPGRGDAPERTPGAIRGPLPGPGGGYAPFRPKLPGGKPPPFV